MNIEIKVGQRWHSHQRGHTYQVIAVDAIYANPQQAGFVIYAAVRADGTVSNALSFRGEEVFRRQMTLTTDDAVGQGAIPREWRDMGAGEFASVDTGSKVMIEKRFELNGITVHKTPDYWAIIDDFDNHFKPVA